MFLLRASYFLDEKSLRASSNSFKSFSHIVIRSVFISSCSCPSSLFASSRSFLACSVVQLYIKDAVQMMERSRRRRKNQGWNSEKVVV